MVFSPDLFSSTKMVMPKYLKVTLFLIHILPFITDTPLCSQNGDKNHVRFMFYNVENLFDIYDDTLKDDNEFLPGGLMRWNSSRYEKKINSIYKTIIAAGEWSPPEVVAMCEIENRNTLADLIYNSYLSKYNYRIIHEESADVRGIDVCLIYRPDNVSIIEYRYWKPNDINIVDYRTRSVLYTKLVVKSDTIHLFVNHWPSRRGGVLAGEDLRIKIAYMVRNKVDSINHITGGKAKVIIMGDYNSSPDDIEVRSLTERRGGESFLKNLSENLDKSTGTYRYRGAWEMIDQVIVSENLLSVSIGAYTTRNGLHVFTPDFLIEKDPTYPGFMPSPAYRGYRYNGGTSDHLPVILNIYFRDSISQE
jgi:predicted extracellular nuclease